VEKDTNPGTMRTTWQNGGTAIGAWISLRDPWITEVASNQDFDYVCIDVQHGLQGTNDIFSQLQSMTGKHPTPVVRVPWNEPGIIGRVLDMGAMGVIIPMVNSREEAEAAVSACRYAPIGGRSMGPIVPMQRYGNSYFATANERVICIPMIETATAVSRIDDILSVPGIDAIYVGPADLSISLGLPPGVDNEDSRFVDAIDTILDACRRHQVVPGIHCALPWVQKRHEQGFRMITVSSDHMAVAGGLKADAAKSRDLTKSPSAGGTTGGAGSGNPYSS